MGSRESEILFGNHASRLKKSTNFFSGLGVVLVARGYERQKASGQYYWLWYLSSTFYIYACHRQGHEYANKVFIDAALSDLNNILSRVKGIFPSPRGTTTNSKFEKFQVKRVHLGGNKTEHEGWRFQFVDSEAFEKFLDVCEAYDTGGLEAARLKADQFEHRAIPQTGKKTVTEVRIGQQDFRKRLLKHWKACAVTGCTVEKILKASHIKPWSVASPDERLDLFNGLLLLPTLDALFDSGLITFDDEGKIVVSSLVPACSYEALALSETMRIRKYNTAHVPYMRYHRQSVFKP